MRDKQPNFFFCCCQNTKTLQIQLAVIFFLFLFNRKDGMQILSGSDSCQFLLFTVQPTNFESTPKNPSLTQTLKTRLFIYKSGIFTNPNLFSPISDPDCFFFLSFFKFWFFFVCGVFRVPRKDRYLLSLLWFLQIPQIDFFGDSWIQWSQMLWFENHLFFSALIWWMILMNLIPISRNCEYLIFSLLGL